MVHASPAELRGGGSLTSSVSSEKALAPWRWRFPHPVYSLWGWRGELSASRATGDKRWGAEPWVCWTAIMQGSGLDAVTASPGCGGGIRLGWRVLSVCRSDGSRLFLKRR